MFPMLPISFGLTEVIGLLTSLGVLNQLEVNRQVSTVANGAFNAGSAVGAVGGAVAGAVAANPGAAPNMLSLPLRALNAPFYYLLGGHAADQRIRVLELAAEQHDALRQTWFDAMRTKALQFDGLELKLSESYISILKSGFAGLASAPSGAIAAVAGGSATPTGAAAAQLSAAGAGQILMGNPCPPSLCLLGEFIDPFGARYTCVVFNDVGRRLVTSVLVVTACWCGGVLLLIVLRMSVRYSLRAFRAMSRLVSEERAKEHLRLLKAVQAINVPGSLPYPHSHPSGLHGPGSLSPSHSQAHHHEPARRDYTTLAPTPLLK
jgi:hypothetical protein